MILTMLVHLVCLIPSAFTLIHSTPDSFSVAFPPLLPPPLLLLLLLQPRRQSASAMFPSQARRAAFTYLYYSSTTVIQFIRKLRMHYCFSVVVGRSAAKRHGFYPSRSLPLRFTDFYLLLLLLIQRFNIIFSTDSFQLD